MRSTGKSIVVVLRNYMTGADTLNIYLAFFFLPDFLLFQNANKNIVIYIVYALLCISVYIAMYICTETYEQIHKCLCVYTHTHGHMEYFHVNYYTSLSKSIFYICMCVCNVCMYNLDLDTDIH